MKRAVRLGAWMLGIAAFGYFAIGGLLYLAPIGLDWAAFPLGGSIERNCFAAWVMRAATQSPSCSG